MGDGVLPESDVAGGSCAGVAGRPYVITTATKNHFLLRVLRALRGLRPLRGQNRYPSVNENVLPASDVATPVIRSPFLRRTSSARAGGERRDAARQSRGSRRIERARAKARSIVS